MVSCGKTNLWGKVIENYGYFSNIYFCRFKSRAASSNKNGFFLVWEKGEEHLLKGKFMLCLWTYRDGGESFFCVCCFLIALNSK